MKDVFAIHIVVQNLPFTYIECQTLLGVVKLLNPEAVQLMVKADAMADHVIKMYGGIRSELRVALSDPSLLVINCTCDVWTSPNNFGIFAVTGHWTDKDSTLKVYFLCAILFPASSFI